MLLLRRGPRASSGLFVEYAKRNPPRIGGSVGGFIAVVVCLCVIIVASCIAIFVLLRDREPSTNEREARRAARDRNRNRHTAVEPELAPAPAPARAPSPAPSPWGSLSRMFRNATRGGHGWIQASGDAWEADEADAEREMGMAPQHEDAPFRPPADPYALADDAEIRWTPRFTASHSTFSDASAVPRSASPESDHTVEQQQQHTGYSQSRQFSADSMCSVRTFEGGTKFIEGL